MSDLATAKTWTAARWVSLAQSVGALADLLGQAKNDQARAITLGKFLGGKVGREIPLAVGGKTGKAVLRSTPGRSRQTGYYFVVTWDRPAGDAPKHPGTKKKLKSKDKPRAGAKDQKKAQRPTSTRLSGGNDEEW